MRTLIGKLESAGLDVQDSAELIKIIKRKSLFRYKKIIMRYKELNDCNKVTQTKINEIYKNDIKLRRVLWKLISATEVSLYAEIENSLMYEEITPPPITKASTEFENKFINQTEPKYFNAYKSVKRGFKFQNKNTVLNFHQYLSKMSFGLLSVTYWAIDTNSLVDDKRVHPSTDELKEKFEAIRIIRNAIAHHELIYLLDRKQIETTVEFLYSLYDFDALIDKDSENIKSKINFLLENMYN